MTEIVVWFTNPERTRASAKSAVQLQVLKLKLTSKVLANKALEMAAKVEQPARRWVDLDWINLGSCLIDSFVFVF